MVGNRYMYFIFFTFYFLITFTGAGYYCQAFAEESAEAEQNNDKDAYIIDVGDALEINVWKEVELTRQVIVRLDGRISLPLIGDVMAAGNNPMELAKILEEKIGEIIEEPTVTVILTASNSRVYYMVGNISSGKYPLDTPINLLQAIAIAGGLGEWADRDDIMLVRRSSGKDELLSFDYKTFVKGKDLAQNILIQYGDTIIVP